MAHLVVERSFTHPLTNEDLDRMAARLSPCLEQYGARWMRSYLSHDRQRMICAFEAADAEAVRMAHRIARVEFSEVWTAKLYIQAMESQD